MFCGSEEIKVVFRAQRRGRRVDLHKVLLCEVGVLQGAGDRNGGAADEGGIIEGISDFCFWLEGGRFFRSSGEFRVVVHALGDSWVMIYVGSSSVWLSSFGERGTALVVRPVGGVSLWGFQVSTFGWEVEAVFFAAVEGSKLLDVPRRITWAQISTRWSSVRLGYFRT